MWHRSMRCACCCCIVETGSVQTQFPPFQNRRKFPAATAIKVVNNPSAVALAGQKARRSQRRRGHTRAPISIQGGWMAEPTWGTLTRWWAREDASKCKVQQRGRAMCAEPSLRHILPKTTIKPKSHVTFVSHRIKYLLLQGSKLLNCVALLDFLTTKALQSSVTKFIVLGITNCVCKWSNFVR